MELATKASRILLRRNDATALSCPSLPGSLPAEALGLINLFCLWICLKSRPLVCFGNVNLSRFCHRAMENENDISMFQKKK